MLRFALRRAASALLTLLGVLALVVGLMAAAPGDAAALAARAGSSRAAAVSPAALDAFRRLYGLDRPAPERFVLWVVRAARLDFGLSLVDGRPVGARISSALPVTLALNAGALLLALCAGVPLGVAAARRPGGALDRLSGAVGDALFATPSFVLGLVLLLVFSGWLRWTPLFSDAGSGLPGHALPALTLGLPAAAFLARFTRACVASALADPATAAGRARGEGSGAAVRRALRRSAAPFAAMAAALVPSLVTGSVLVERVFSMPGAGGLLADAVFARDVPTVLGLTLLSAGAVVAATLGAEIVSAVLDPRTRDAAAEAPVGAPA
jgi:peptide/nickel transport system permease protein